MANWCDTSIAFYAPNKSSALESLHTTISKLTEENNGLDNICAFHGLDPDNYSCRGEVYWIGEISQDKDDYWYFMINQEDAWDPHIGVWRAILERQYPAVGMVYRAEEPGMGIFINSDREGWYFPERFIVDTCINDTEDKIYCTSAKETLSLCQFILQNRSISSLDHAREIGAHLVKKEGDDGWFNIYVFTES